MRRYYHVARGIARHENEKIVLSRQWATLLPELAPLVYDLFPDGISEHGVRYCLMPLYSQAPDTVPLAFFASGVVDMTCEYVRRCEYRDCPSRMQSIFAWRTLADARAWRTYIGGGTIFEITSQSARPPFRADMKNLEIIPNFPFTAAVNARRYWSGEASPSHLWLGNPHPKPIWEFLLTLPATVGRKVE